MSLCGDYLNITRSNVQLTGMWLSPEGHRVGGRGGCVLAAMKNLNKIPNCAKWVLGANLGYKLLLYQSRIQKQIPLQRMKMRNYL